MAQKRSKATRREAAEAASARAAAIREEQQRKERRRRNLVVTAVVVVVLGVVGVMATVLQSSRDTTGQSGALPQNMASTYAVPVGDTGAPVTVDLYEDFMCPICGELEDASRGWVQQYVDSGKMQLRYHVMSFLDSQSNGTEYSTRAANAFAVVTDTAGPEVAKKFHDLLYENQPQEGQDGLTDDQLVAYAVQAGADQAQVEKPIKDRAFEQWVKNATDQANRDGVNGTPTVKVDGTAITDFTSMQDLSDQFRAQVDAQQ